MKYFDSHCHLNMEPLLEKEKELIDWLQKNEFGANVVGIDIASSWVAVRLAKYSNIYATVGIHPCDVPDNIENILSEFEKMKKSSDKIISVGETGFDFFHEEKTNEIYQKQLDCLNIHYQFAKKYSLPLMMHVRNGHNEMLEWIDNVKYNKIIIHCFSENIEIAKEYINRGCYLSIPGIVTFKNASLLVESLRYIPIDKIISETDSPYLAPMPYRGKINKPNYVVEVVKKIAEIKNIDLDEMRTIILNNTKIIFGL